MTATRVFRAPWVLPINAAPIRDGAVAVTAGRIVAVGRDLDGEALDVDGVLLPGLVNAHAHLQYGPSFADIAGQGLPFPVWLATLTARRRATPDADWLTDAHASAAAMLATGTTAVADVVTNAAALPGRSALAGCSYIEGVGADDARWAATERARLLAGLAEARAEGLDAGLSPHSPYTLGTEVYRQIVGLARDRGLRQHPHLAESLAEVQYVATGTGPPADAWRATGLDMELVRDGGAQLTPTAYIASLGGLGPDVHVAHGVHVNAADRALLRAHGSAVALCTRSNQVLAAGEAPVAAYRAEGNPVAVGTDSLASCPDLDLLAELRALRALAVRQGSEEAGLDQWLVEAATAGGAVALGMTGQIGALRVGARADMVVVQGEGDDPWTQVVTGAVRAVCLAGEWMTS